MKCEDVVNGNFFLTGIRINGTFYTVEKINKEGRYLICSQYDDTNAENADGINDLFHVFNFQFDELDSVDTEYYQSVKIN